MENKLDEKNKRIIVVSILVIFSVYAYFQLQENKKNDDLEKIEMFTLGRVVEYSPRVLQTDSSSPKLKFAYKVQGKDYLEESYYDVPDKNGPQPGSLFMAVYLQKYPQICTLLLNCPVKSAAEYNKYIEEFKIHCPKFDK